MPIAVQVVLMAFRTGGHVAALADCLHRDSESPDNWTYVLPGVGEAAATAILSDFHKQNVRKNSRLELYGIDFGQNTTLASHAYISAVTSSSIVISGPPATLKLLFSSKTFDAQPMPIPVRGPYHAAHLYTGLNAEKILHLKDPRVQQVFGNAKPKCQLMSCTTGAWYSEKSSTALIKSVLRDVLTKTLQLHKVLEGCVLKAQNYRGPKCLVIKFGEDYPEHVIGNI